MIYGDSTVVSVSVVYPPDRTGEWEPGLMATAQNHERVSHCIIPAWEKLRTENLTCSFC